MKGTLTKQCYTTTSVFVDNFSKLSYIHLQRQITSQETSEAKEHFERIAKSYNVRVRHYHADNGRFADNLYVANVKKQGQNISYAGVNAHF